MLRRLHAVALLKSLSGITKISIFLVLRKLTTTRVYHPGCGYIGARAIPMNSGPPLTQALAIQTSYTLSTHGCYLTRTYPGANKRVPLHLVERVKERMERRGVRGE